MSDESLFSEAMADVRRLQVKSRIARPAASDADSPGAGRRRAAAVSSGGVDSNYLQTGQVPAVGPQDLVGYRRPGIQHGVYARLRRGDYEPQAVLDLHRRTVAQARVELWEFLEQSRRRQMRTVMIVHGKGARDPDGGALKRYAAHWLKQLPEVLAFHSARPWHGGAGALYVLLKKSDRASDNNRERYETKRNG